MSRPWPPIRAVLTADVSGDGPEAAPWGPRLVLATGTVFGLAYLWALYVGRPHMLGVNSHVYYLAGAAVGTGADLYAIAPPGFAHLRWVYPPVVALAFLPYGWLPSPGAAFVAHTALTLAGGVVLAGLLVRLAERAGARLAPVDRLLVGAFVVGSIHTAPSLYYGNVNLLLVAALAAAVARLDRAPRSAGALFALPAVVKVFPAAFGLWLLHRRAWRAIVAAVGTGLTAVAASLLAFGVDAHRAYLVEALLPRRRTADFVGGLDPNTGYLTIKRPLSILFPSVDPTTLTLLAAAVLAPVAAYLLAGDPDRPTADLVALHGTLAAVLLFVTSYQTYFVFLLVTLVPLLYALEPGRARSVFVAGALVANVAVSPASVAGHLPPGLAEPLLAVLTPILTLGSPRLYGTLLTLLACVLHRRRDGDVAG